MFAAIFVLVFYHGLIHQKLDLQHLDHYINSFIGSW